MWNNSYISAVIEVFTMHWVMEPSITYGQLWLLIRYWPFWVAHFTNLTVNVSGAYWECQHSFISIGGNHRQVSWSHHDHPESPNVCYLLWCVQIPQEVWGPGGHARQDGAPPGLRQLHRARDARGAGEDDVIYDDVIDCYTMLHTITCAWCRCTPSASCWRPCSPSARTRLSCPSSKQGSRSASATSPSGRTRVWRSKEYYELMLG